MEFYLVTNKNKITKTLKSNTQNNQIKSLIFSKSEFKKIIWMNKNEFSYHSNLYDLKKFIKSKNNIKIICFLDKFENKIISIFHKNNSNDTKDNCVLKIIKNLSNQNLPPLSFEMEKPNIEFKKTIKVPIKSVDKKHNAFILSLDKPPIFCS